MKRKLLATLLSVTALITTAAVFTGCSSQTAAAPAPAAPEAPKAVVLKVGSAQVPHAEILNFIKPKLAKEGVDLQVVVLDDDGQLNPALQEKQIDANYFQHIPYLNSVAKEKGYDFVSIANVHVEPIGLYSSKIKDFKELKDGAQIAIPNNPSNEFRALTLLEVNGLIKLKPGIADFKATPADIVENPKKIKFIEVDSGQLTRSLPDVDASVINTNLVLEAKIDPNSALIREDAKSPYGNIVVVRKGDETRPEVEKLKNALLSDDVREFIKTKYGVAVVPAF